MSIRTVITGTGRYLPPKVVSNFDLEKIMNTTDDWIVQRSGIRTRRYAEDGVGSMTLGLEAAKAALEDARCAPADVDFIIAATLSPDHYFPGIGVEIQAALGCGPIGALDVRAQCSGFIYALSVADQFIRAGTYKKILVVASEVQSHNLDYSDAGRDMAVLFGDGAGAVVCEPSTDGSGHLLLSTHLFGDGRFSKILSLDVPSSRRIKLTRPRSRSKKLYYPRMDGKRVFINAVERMPEASPDSPDRQQPGDRRRALAHPHQANDHHFPSHGRPRIKIPSEKVVRNINANTTAASIPIALDETVKAGLLEGGRPSSVLHRLQLGIHLGLGRPPVVIGTILACFKTEKMKRRAPKIKKCKKLFIIAIQSDLQICL